MECVTGLLWSQSPLYIFFFSPFPLQSHTHVRGQGVGSDRMRAAEASGLSQQAEQPPDRCCLWFLENTDNTQPVLLQRARRAFISCQGHTLSQAAIHTNRARFPNQPERNGPKLRLLEKIIKHSKP